jgi:hypothetical protein
MERKLGKDDGKACGRMCSRSDHFQDADKTRNKKQKEDEGERVLVG